VGVAGPVGASLGDVEGRSLVVAEDDAAGGGIPQGVVGILVEGDPDAGAALDVSSPPTRVALICGVAEPSAV
jgi:hypothetical protein